MKRVSVIGYIGAFLGTVALAVLLLAFSAYLPQDPIDRNVKTSAEKMIEEGVYPRIADKTFASRLDNWTDAVILMECKATNSENLETILTNPRFEKEGESNPVERLYGYVLDDDAQPAWYYVRYWLGFRTYLRLALVFFDYYQIRRYLAFVFFALFSAVLCSMAKRVHTRMAMVFALCIALVRPYVICVSLQFSCCFLIAFAAMLMIPWLNRHPEYDKLVFMEIGMLTMYFDFYTTPLITLGLPLIYLYILRTIDGKRIEEMNILANCVMWFMGYGLMWISKLVLTNLFTSQNGFASGFKSLFGWLGVNGMKKENATYDIGQAFQKVLQAVFADDEGRSLWLTVIAVFAGALIWALIRKKLSVQALRNHVILLFLGALPIIWFCVSAAPIYTHFWFQYRSVVLLYWAIGAYVSLCGSRTGEMIPVK